MSLFQILWRSQWQEDVDWAFKESGWPFYDIILIDNLLRVLITCGPTFQEEETNQRQV